jgi:hypothetical protein
MRDGSKIILSSIMNSLLVMRVVALLFLFSDSEEIQRFTAPKDTEM